MGGSELKLEDRLLPQEAGTLDLPTGDIARTIAGVLSVSPRVALSGDIGAAGGLADLIGFIHASRWTGALRVLDAGTAREIRFLAGEVRAASSNRAADRLGEILFRYG